jgi:predicted MFS family arabinose efflux permease
VAVAAVYLVLLGGGSAWPLMGLMVVLWGILGGINANINQYWLASAAPEAPDFANGLFLTAANLGCVLGTLCLYGEGFLLGTANSHRKGGWLR